MLILETGFLPEELSSEPHVRPWRLSKTRRPPTLLQAIVDEKEILVTVQWKPKFGSTNVDGSSSRLAGFGGGSYRLAIDSRFSKVDKSWNGREFSLQLVSCSEEEDELILLGYFCGKRDATYQLTPDNTQMLFVEESSIYGFPVFVFAARLEDEAGYIMFSRTGQTGSFVDIFSSTGHQQLQKKHLSSVPLQH